MFMVMSSSLVLSGLGRHAERANPEIEIAWNGIDSWRSPPGLRLLTMFT